MTRPASLARRGAHVSTSFPGSSLVKPRIRSGPTNGIRGRGMSASVDEERDREGEHGGAGDYDGPRSAICGDRIEREVLHQYDGERRDHGCIETFTSMENAAPRLPAVASSPSTSTLMLSLSSRSSAR